jgi:hypothetical protein
VQPQDVGAQGGGAPYSNGGGAGVTAGRPAGSAVFYKPRTPQPRLHMTRRARSSTSPTAPASPPKPSATACLTQFGDTVSPPTASRSSTRAEKAREAAQRIREARRGAGLRPDRGQFLRGQRALPDPGGKRRPDAGHLRAFIEPWSANWASPHAAGGPGARHGRFRGLPSPHQRDELRVDARRRHAAWTSTMPKSS